MDKSNFLFSMLTFMLGLLAACAPTLTAAPDILPTSTIPPEQPASTAEIQVHLPTETPVPPACEAQEGTVEGFDLDSEFLPDGLQFRVYMPPCYGMEPDRRYPVLYLVHGQTYTEDQWERLGAVSQADRLIASGDLPPFIMVLPYDKSWAQPGQDLFGQALVAELIPFIDETYLTEASRESRALGGLSRGAGWAIHLGLVREESAALFGALGLHSPAVFWTDASRLAARLQAYPREALPRMYIDAGDRDFEMKSILSLLDLLTKYSIPHEWHLYTGYHEEKYWRAHVEEYLRWYTAGWR